MHGALGLSQDSFLADAYAAARSLRIADGPDVVHELSLGKFEMNHPDVRSWSRL
jgi:acyl-CoA dehydrogenase